MAPRVLILFWKDLLIRKNHPIVTAVEIIIPISFVILANLLFSIPPREEIDKDHMSFEYFLDKKCSSKHDGYYGSIIYEPSTPFTDALMAKASCYAGYRKSNVKSGKISDNSSYFNIGVKFELNNSSFLVPDVLNYTLYPTNTLWVNLNTLWKNNGRSVPKYSTLSVRKVIELQRAIDASFLSMKNVTTNKINLENTSMHVVTFSILFLLVYSAIFLELLFMLPPILSRIIQEKYTGAKELMLMMGVRKIDIWVAKFLDAYLIQIINITAIIIFFYVPLKKDSIVLQNNPLELWAIIMLGLIGSIIFLFFVSCFFQQSTIAVLTVGSFWVFTYFANNFFFLSPDIPGYVLYITSLLPHTALINGVCMWLQFQNFGKRVNFRENLITKKGAPVLYEICLLMVLDIALYAGLTWYFENIIPGKYGLPKPFNFLFKKSYWVRPRVDVSQENLTSDKSGSSFESVPANLKVAVSIEHVSKIYKSGVRGSTMAVDNVNLNFYEGEISALLGHNGAGKTTVFSMITGLTYPTSGKIFINDYNIQTNTNEARQSLGLCPQHDMLFKSLSAMQILKFYGMIKGMSLKESKKEAIELVEKLKLEGSENTNCGKLSGGQKRKVSLAIALIGGSKVLILDEPTSGMDPEIRREIWELLLKYRGQRTILLTTHFMEEADALCDRIAIMDHGKVKCYGSSMFLKSKFGKGYVLNVVLPDVDAEKSSKLIEFISQSVSSAKLKAQNVRTLAFELPENKVNVFPSLLSGLEKKQANNEIVSFSINVASLEEVFLSLRSGQDDFDAVDSSRYTKLNLSEEPNLFKTRGFFFFYQQMCTLFVKKLIIYRKSYLSLLAFVILPTALVVLVAFLPSEESHSGSEVDLSGSRPLSYSSNLYNPSVVLFTNHHEPGLKDAFQNYIRSLGMEVQETPNITQTVYESFQNNFYTYSRLINLGVEFFEDKINIFHNQEAVHMVPVSLNLIHNFLLNYAKRNSSIVTVVDPKFANKDTYTYSSMTQKCTVMNILDFGGAHSFFYLIGPVKENFYGAKELQLMVTSPVLYWLTHLIWDILSFFIYILLVYIGMGFSQVDDSMLQDPVEVLSGYFLWGIGLLLICYVISSFLKNLAAAFSVNVSVYVIFTFILFFFIDLQVVSRNFQYLHPSCILKLGIVDLCGQQDRNFIWKLIVYDLVLFCFLILKDSKILNFAFHRLINALAKVNYSVPGEAKEELVQEDENTVRAIVQNKIRSDHVLIANELKRWFCKKIKAKPAVRGVSFAVGKGECFGLLGVNGAGKTTTFKMLTGELPSSHGSTYVCSKKLSPFTRQKYLFAIGYCPQFDGLIPVFTGVEMLTFFARLRGIHPSNVNEQVEKWLSKLGLLEFAKKRCGTYSGGNQRKLSTAVALIGDCPLIFMDEPTTGVDPLSRRAIWNLIAEIQTNGQSIVLTSHSMDECEALCSRVAIMVKGKFRCIGETTLLKDKFGQGYSIRLKIVHDASDAQLESLKSTFAVSFEGSELVDEHLTVLQYKVTNKHSSAEIFKKLLDLKKKFEILESYSASAATLEQIFISFAREQ